MITVRKTDIESEEFTYFEERNFYQNHDLAGVIGEVARSGGFTFYIAECDGALCGFAMAEMANAKVGEILLITVAPDYRDKGVGKAILDYMIDDMKPKAVVAQVSEDSLGFFEKYGFFGSELGESVNDMQVYYMTYRIR